MAIFTETVEVDVGPENFDDDELIIELKSRGYFVEKGLEPEMFNVVQYWQRGDKKEALFLLEREVPELYGISKLVS